MLKQSLVYIRAVGGGQSFVGCGAYIEQNLIVTCRHVWRDAGEAAEAVFPHANPDGDAPQALSNLSTHAKAPAARTLISCCFVPSICRKR
jgi:hypothetical protein